MAGAEGDMTSPITAEGRPVEASACWAGFDGGRTPAAFVAPSPAPAEDSGSPGAELPSWSWMESFTLWVAWS